jgi:hypothetical protein
MANGKIPNFNNKFYGDKLVEVTFPDSTSSLGFDEYNAVLNNVNSSVSSSIIMDADYALNARIPTNNDRLLSGTAQRMEIQDSNYSSVAWTSPRYVGSQTISATYNDYQSPGSSVTFADGTVGPWKGDQVFDEYPGDETFKRGNPLGKVPAVDLYSTHFVLFDRINIDDALFDRDVFHCLYLIDDQSNKVPLTYKNKNLVDLRRLFIQGSNAEVVFLGQNDQELLDDYPIERVGIVNQSFGNITNDIFTFDSSLTQLFAAGANYSDPNFSSTNPPWGCAVSLWGFTYNSQGIFGDSSDNSQFNCVADIGFSPSLFEVTLLGNDEYILKHSLSGSGYDRTHYLGNNFSRACASRFIIDHMGYGSGIYNGSEKRSLSLPTYTGKSVVSVNDGGGEWESYGVNNDPILGRYINNLESYDESGNAPVSYSLNENRLDPFYIVTYNSQTSKVLEGTIYETIIGNAQFRSTNPRPWNGTEVGAVSPISYINGTNMIQLDNTTMEPQSDLSSQILPITVGSGFTFDNYSLYNNISYGLFEQNGSNTSELINEFFTNTISSEHIITEISIGEKEYESLYKITSPISTAQTGSYRLTLVSNDSSVYADPTAYTQTDNSIHDGDFIAHISEGGSFTNSPGNRGINPGLIPPGNIFALTFATSSTSYWGSGSGQSGPSPSNGVRHNNSEFFKTLRHGDIIELAQYDDFNPEFEYIDYPNGLPDDKIWRYLILRAPDYYNPNNPHNDEDHFPRPYYRFHVQYINGHNGDNIDQGSNGGALWDDNPFSNNGDGPRIILHKIIRMEDPYIKIKQLSGDNIISPSGSINQPTTILGLNNIKEHEQYIESQFLEGTGVGVLIPDNYDPKLREQLPDIINKTGIDINSLVQGNN